MKKIALIPGRMASTRFPGKLLAKINGKSVILRTYESALKTGLFDDVVVVCDGKAIADEIIDNGGKAVISSMEHESGSDRIAEAVKDMDADVVVNVQGDAPFVGRESLASLLAVFEGEQGSNVQVASLMMELKEQEFIDNPNFVKVVVDRNNNSLLFSRLPIPYARDRGSAVVYYKHIGVYAYRKKTLLEFTTWPVTPLEAAEKIECLRYLEYGIPLKMVKTVYDGVEVDAPEDIQRAIEYLEKKQL
jgi:3-deoxy-manno-octulosonate cytidylyltransferase (CMP-KDO synthetase)